MQIQKWEVIKNDKTKYDQSTELLKNNYHKKMLGVT